MLGRITRDTNIGPDQVKKGEVLEVDKATFAQLFRNNAIQKCDAPPAETGGEQILEVKQAAPKFRRVSTKPKPAADPVVTSAS